MKIRDIFCLFCWPPCPSRIAAKIAFHPPDPSYSFLPVKSGSTTKYTFHLTKKSDWQFTDKEKDSIEVFFTPTSRSNKLACMFVKCCSNAKYCILFSHCNAADLGHMSSFYFDLGTNLNCNVFSYDYSGYGVSTGRPSEKNMYSDIDAAWNALIKRYGISPENIILYGRSIGTVPTIDLASRYKVGGVILQSPLTSGIRVLLNTKKTCFFDAFPSIEKVSKITSPVLVIHGTKDNIVDFSHGLAIYEKCPNAVEPLWIGGAGHHDVELYSKYWERLKQFVQSELIN
ncbi:Protein ABHD17C [Armadillidium vulgare]|nr:Protein ABHD17C [Armadillidium vulgare]